MFYVQDFTAIRIIGILKDDMFMYGVNAYINNPFMATPFKVVSSGVRDAYNLYHSQLRMNVECSFSVLVN